MREPLPLVTLKIRMNPLLEISFRVPFDKIQASDVEPAIDALLTAAHKRLDETIVDPLYYSKPFKSDHKIWKLIKDWDKEWDEQIYCVPSEELKFNNLIRDGNVGK